MSNGWVQLRTEKKKELSLKMRLLAKRRRREFLDVWSIKMGQLERVYSEQMGVAK